MCDCSSVIADVSDCKNTDVDELNRPVNVKKCPHGDRHLNTSRWERLNHISYHITTFEIKTRKLYRMGQEIGLRIKLLLWVMTNEKCK